MRFFNHCKTQDEIKAEYKKLAKQHHPDTGGDTATMQAVNTEYAYATARLAKAANQSAEQTEKEIKFSEEYRKVIQQIINLPDITVELVGLWLWVTGKTRPVRKELSAAGFRFAPKKQAWYYRSEQFKQRKGSSRLSLAQIKSKYGSSTIKEEQERDAATGKPNKIETKNK